jgi:hypothetical protein
MTVVGTQPRKRSVLEDFDVQRYRKECRRHIETERLRGLKIDNKLKFCWKLNGQSQQLAPFTIRATYPAARRTLLTPQENDRMQPAAEYGRR